MAAVFNKIRFEYGPWGCIDGYQKVVDGYEVALLTEKGEELPIAGHAYGYSIIEPNASPSFQREE